MRGEERKWRGKRSSGPFKGGQATAGHPFSEGSHGTQGRPPTALRLIRSLALADQSILPLYFGDNRNSARMHDDNLFWVQWWISLTACSKATKLYWVFMADRFFITKLVWSCSAELGVRSSAHSWIQRSRTSRRHRSHRFSGRRSKVSSWRQSSRTIPEPSILRHGFSNCP